MPISDYFGGVWIARWLFQRGLAAIYLLAFWGALNQFRVLLGERGLQPAPRFIEAVPFKSAPSIFYLFYSDRFVAIVAWVGIALSVTALLGASDSGPVWLSMSVWLSLWMLYVSIINVGQTFYAFGWESMLAEAGFFAAFLGPSHSEPSLIPMVILRWMLFRVELGAGLIKLRNDECWRNFTCLFYHHETQPIPNPFSWYFHRLPEFVHRAGVGFSHFVQLVVPFGLFLPQPFAEIAAGFMIVHQLWLVVSGNYAWLNWLTIVLGVTAFSDSLLHSVVPVAVPLTTDRALAYEVVLYVLGGATVLLSIQPTLNFFSRDQLMNYSYNPLHLVNVYGAFGSVTRKRYEIVVEGLSDGEWREYEFKAKPGDPNRRPPQVAPYHLRLDWLMWFLPLHVSIAGDRVVLVRRERWFLRFVRKLLEGDEAVLKLLRRNPFPNARPSSVRAHLYRYEFSSNEERASTGAWWKRVRIGEYLPPATVDDLPD